MSEYLPAGLRWVGFDLDDALHDLRGASSLVALVAVALFSPACAARSAAGADATEHLHLLFTLRGQGARFGAPIATACASVKFLLMMVAVIHALWGHVARLLAYRSLRQIA